MLREWKPDGKNTILVDNWTILNRDARIIPLFGLVLSSNAVASLNSMPCVAEDIIGALMLFSQESNDPIKIVINNRGGSINDGFAINQAMEHVKAKGIEVWTINICQAASMAAVLLMMGTKGRRYVLNNTITHLHSGSMGGGGGRPEDVDSFNEFAKKHYYNTLHRWLLENTNLPEYWNTKSDAQYTPEQLAKTDIRVKLMRDFIQGERFLLASEAVEAGVADKVLMPGDPLIDDIFRAATPEKRG